MYRYISKERGSSLTLAAIVMLILLIASLSLTQRIGNQLTIDLADTLGQQRRQVLWNQPSTIRAGELDQGVVILLNRRCWFQRDEVQYGSFKIDHLTLTIPRETSNTETLRSILISDGPTQFEIRNVN